MQSDRNLKRTIIRNASANVFRLAGSGIVALLLPPFLVRRLSPETYGAWAILLQLTVYVGFLDFGIQTAVARFVAHADELNDAPQRDGIVSTAFLLLSMICLLALILVGVLSWQLPHIFRTMPADLYRGARIALLLMGGSFAISLPVCVIHAIFTGLQKSEVPAAILVGNRFCMALLVVAAVLHHRGLAVMGGAVAIANLASYVASYTAWRTRAHEVRIRLQLAAKKYARQIGSYAAAMSVWMAGMLLVSGLDLTIVGIFEYKATAYYAVAATLSNFVAQAQNAVFAALLPASAVLAARGDAQRLGTMLVSSTRYGMLLLLAIVLPLIFGAPFVLRFWVGANYALHAALILQVLLIANVVRLCVLPYATLLLGTGQQRKVILSPLAEGFTNLAASIAGAFLWGAIGVAVGTLIGSFVSAGLHLFYNVPRTSLISVSRSHLLKQGLARPLLCAAPLIVIVAVHMLLPDLSAAAIATFAAIALAVALLLFWNYGLIGSERRRLEGMLRLSRG
jgi:O-antigen/teichoic acid export membrane protein